MEHDNRFDRAVAAVALSARGDHTAATDLVIDLVTEDPTCTAAHRAWGRVLLDQKRYTDSVAAFRTATELAPNDAEVWIDLAYSLVMHAEEQPFHALTSLIEAGEAVDRALDLDPRSEIATSLRELITRNRNEALVII